MKTATVLQQHANYFFVLGITVIGKLKRLLSAYKYYTICMGFICKGFPGILKQHPCSIPDLCAKDSISSTAPGVVFVQTVRFHATPYPRWVPGQGSAFLILFWDAQ